MAIVVDVCVVTPFRRPLFRHMISHRYPVAEPWDSPQFQVAASLEAADMKVSVLPLQTLFPSFEPGRDGPVLDELLESYDSRVLLFCGDHFVASRSTATVFGIQETLLSLRRIGRTPTTALMGRLATTAAARMLTMFPQLDAALLGECDLQVPEFVRRVLDGRDVTELPFVSTRRQPHAVPERLQSLAGLPRPAYHLARPMIEWGRKTGRVTCPVPFSLRTSAGCVFRCRFCAGVPDWTKWRTKSPAQLAEELSWFQSSLGDAGQIVFLEDELLTVDSAHIDTVVAAFSALGIRLAGFYTHSRFLDFDRAKRLAAVFDRVYLGMDSADDNVLKSMAKQQTVDSMLGVLQAIRGSGLGIHVECVVGSPSETRQSLLKNLAALHHFILLGLVDAANTYVFAPHPGTTYGESPSRYGFEVVDGLDCMQESGGYPSIRSKYLSQNEVFVAYLISQIVIQDAMQQVRASGPQQVVGDVNFAAFDALFSRIAGQQS